MKKILTLLTFLSFSIFFYSYPIPFEIDGIWDLGTIEEMEKEEPVFVRTTANNLNNYLNIFLKDIEEPLLQDTKPPKGRDTLYLIPYKLTAIEYGGLCLNLFFNMTNRMNVTASTSLNLNSEKVVGNIDEIIKYFLEHSVFSQSDLSGFASLLRKITIQERKAGCLLQAGFLYKSFNIQLHTSLQYSERNFWLSKKDQARLRELFKDQDKEFDKKELYKEKYGFGDTRIKLGLNTINLSSLAFDVGFEGIIPTGGKEKLESNINYDIPDTENELQSWAVENTKLIRDNLITPRPGNNGHWGVGFFMESKIALFHNAFNLWNRFSFDNIFKGNESRLMLFKKTINNDELYNDENTKFTQNIANFIRENIFPYPFRVSIKPGNILNFVSAINFNINKRLEYGIGYDLYMQEEEKIEKIFDDQVNPNALIIEDAETQKVIQHKIFTDTTYTIKHRKWDMLLGLGGDLTFDSKNIGRDWTIYLKLGASF